MILVISRFGFECWVRVLIASVPDLCILFTSPLPGVLDTLYYTIVAITLPFSLPCVKVNMGDTCKSMITCHRQFWYYTMHQDTFVSQA